MLTRKSVCTTILPCTILLCGATLAWSADTAKSGAAKATPAPAGPKAGIKTPGILIPFSSLKNEAQVTVETPAWITAADSILIPDRAKDVTLRVDTKNNKTLDPISVKKPCAGALSAFGSLWQPSCETKELLRLDPKTLKTIATIPAGVGDMTIGIASVGDSVWLLSDNKVTLSRIDPAENKVVGEMRLSPSCNSLLSADNSLWVTCPSENKIVRIDPVKNLIVKRIEVSATPKIASFGDGSIWVLCEKDGKIDRIDTKTNKVTKSIELGTPGIGGVLAYGENFLWVSQPGYPLARIDTKDEKVMQQFWGEGGGLLAVSSGAIWIGNPSKGGVARFDTKRVIATLAE